MNVTFETLPQIVGEINAKVDRLLSHTEERPEKDFLMTIEQLIDFLPEKPARQTVYQWVNDRKVPYEKHGKRLYFRKSSINIWLANGREMKTVKSLR